MKILLVSMKAKWEREKGKKWEKMRENEREREREILTQAHWCKSLPSNFSVWLDIHLILSWKRSRKS